MCVIVDTATRRVSDLCAGSPCVTRRYAVLAAACCRPTLLNPYAVLHLDCHRLTLPNKDSCKPLSEFCVAVWSDETAEDGRFAVDAAVESALHHAAKALEQAGAVVKYQRPNDLDPSEAHEVYLGLLCGTYAGRIPEKEFMNISREVARAYISDCGGLSGEYDAKYVETLRRHQLTHRDWIAINKDRDRIRSTWHSFFSSGIDIVLAPVSRTAAFPHDHSAATRPFYMPSSRTLDVNGTKTPYTDNVGHIAPFAYLLAPFVETALVRVRSGQWSALLNQPVLRLASHGI